MNYQLCAPTLSRNLARPGDQHDRRDLGFTLFEILLVLILIVIMSSLAVPLLQNSMASFRLRSSTDAMIAAWSKVRARAIETGHVYQFQFIADESKYRIERWYAENRTPDQDQNQDLPPSEELRQDEEDNWHYEAELEEGVKFDGGQQASVDEEGEKQVDSLDSEGKDDWSTPILFFPDGTTSQISIVLKNDKNRYQRTTLRSLTGVARASEMLSQSEVDETSSR